MLWYSLEMSLRHCIVFCFVYLQQSKENGTKGEQSIHQKTSNGIKEVYVLRNKLSNRHGFKGRHHKNMHI